MIPGIPDVRNIQHDLEDDDKPPLACFRTLDAEEIEQEVKEEVEQEVKEVIVNNKDVSN